MAECRHIESQLTPFVDGEAEGPVIREIEAHLAACVQCRARVEVERAARTVLRARAAALVVAPPPGLRTRVAAILRDRERPARGLGWTGRLTAFAGAAVVVVFVLGALELVTPRSNILLAAQLVVDHLRCFVVEFRSTGEADANVLRQRLLDDYGWSIDVPPSSPEADVKLVAARRCPFWLGPHAHLLYRIGRREVSLYVTPGTERSEGELRVLGHVERLWSANGSSYTLIAGGMAPADLERVAAYLVRETEAE